jgi:N-acetylneuraminate synthase
MNIRIGNKYVGDEKPVFMVAEIGINHNGNIDFAKQLIDVAVSAGCDAVKFQKRTIEDVYTKEELDAPRESPWGTTNREQKNGLEFDDTEYSEIDLYCKREHIMWFASCWDKKSVDFIDTYNPPCYKIASPLITNHDLLAYTCKKKKPIILSTGMSTMQQIHDAVDVVNKFTDQLILLHCTSTYPSALAELNLNVIQTLKKMYKYPIGYSGHEVGISSSIVAGVLGAVLIERHITLDRSMYGSDQASSLEPRGVELLVSNIRELPIILGDGTKKVYDSEKPIIKKLRR